MGQICLDNNVYVGILSPDEEKEPYMDVVRDYYKENTIFWAPSYLPAEFFQVLQRKFKTGLLDKSGKEAAEDFFLKLNIVFLYNHDFLRLVLSVQSETGLSYFDSGYLACALYKDVLLVTRDKELAKKGHRICKNIQLI